MCAGDTGLAKRNETSKNRDRSKSGGENSQARSELQQSETF